MAQFCKLLYGTTLEYDTDREQIAKTVNCEHTNYTEC